jgi:hypothetical protein
VTRKTEDVLTRGFDNVVANWPLLLIRLAEGIAFTMIVMGVALGIALGIAASFGLGAWSDYKTAEQMTSLFETLLRQWPVLLIALVGFLLLLCVLVLIHCFVEAGVVRVYVDGERAAGPAQTGDRSRYRVFTGERWLQGAKDGWRALFGIYNVVYSIWAVLLLIPFLPVGIGTLMMIQQEKFGPAAGIGCIGGALLVLIMIPVTIAANLWSRKAIVIAIARRTSTRESLRLGWAEVRGDLARHLLVALAVLGAGLAIGGFIAGFSFAGAMVKSTGFAIMFVPLRILTSLLNTALSGAMAGWLTASYAALSPETKP